MATSTAALAGDGGTRSPKVFTPGKVRSSATVVGAVGAPSSSSMNLWTSTSTTRSRDISTPTLSAGRLASITTCGRRKLSTVEWYLPDEISPFLIASIAAHGVFSSDLERSTTMIHGASPPLARIHWDLRGAHNRSKQWMSVDNNSKRNKQQEQSAALSSASSPRPSKRPSRPKIAPRRHRSTARPNAQPFPPAR